MIGQSKMTDSRLAKEGAAVIYKGFTSFSRQFDTITHRARLRYENQDWPGMHADASQRLGTYRQVIDQVMAQIRDLLQDRLENKLVWASMKAVYSSLLASHDNWEIAETWFNSVTRRIFTTVGVDPQIEFVDTDFETPPCAAKTAVYQTYTRRHTNTALLHTVLTDYAWAVPYADINHDAAQIASRIEAKLRQLNAPPTIDRLEIIRPVFYRGMGAYLVGRIFSDTHIIPLVIAILHTDQGLMVDAVLLEENSVSILFSFAHSYFHVAAERPYDLVRYLKRIMPRKRAAELYISIGYNKHGKTELYRSILRHLANTDDQFQIARGQRGMVMIVFNMPNHDLVFKLIKDQFAYPKNNTRKGVKAKYDLVFRHDRAGRLIDAQAFEYLQFDRRHFDPNLLAELQQVASEVVHVTGEYVVIEHAYVTRRVTPLDIYIQEETAELAEAAVIDYGESIKDMARCNIFPGDMLLKNFGVTRHGRVVFYDYDEITLLGDCNFRRIPPGSYEDELSAEPWFHVAPGDIFPEEFEHFFGLPDDLQTLFMAHHAALCTPTYWRSLQQDIATGSIHHIYPYRPDQRLRND